MLDDSATIVARQETEGSHLGGTNLKLILTASFLLPQ